MCERDRYLTARTDVFASAAWLLTLSGAINFSGVTRWWVASLWLTWPISPGLLGFFSLPRWNFCLLLNCLFTDFCLNEPICLGVKPWSCCGWAWRRGWRRGCWKRSSAQTSTSPLCKGWMNSSPALWHGWRSHTLVVQTFKCTQEQNNELVHGKACLYLCGYGYRCTTPWRFYCCKSLSIIPLKMRLIPSSILACSREHPCWWNKALKFQSLILSYSFN